MRCLLGELELILDSFALKSLFDHDKRNGLTVHLLLDHYLKSKKFIKFDETFFNFLIIKITLIREKLEKLNFFRTPNYLDYFCNILLRECLSGY